MTDDAVARELAQLRHDIKEDVAELRTDLAGLVSRDLHNAELGRVGDRVDSVRRDVDRLVLAIETDRKSNHDRRDADRRMVWGALLAAGLGIIIQILSSTGIAP